MTDERQRGSHEIVQSRDKEKLKLWIKQWLPHGKYVLLDKQDLFLDELIDNYLIEIGLSPDTVNPVEWGEYVLFVEVIKI